jgi:hypothetical protein
MGKDSILFGPWEQRLMIADYPILANTRTCAASGRPLNPGEKVHSVLIAEGAQVVRRDYSQEAWQGPPAGSIAHWVSRVPTVQQKRRLTFDDELLMSAFERLADEPDAQKTQFRYVLALLLLRRRRLKFEDVRHSGGETHLVLSCPKSRMTFEVIDPQLSEDDIRRVQDEVVRLFGWE